MRKIKIKTYLKRPHWRREVGFPKDGQHATLNDNALPKASLLVI